MVNLGDEIEVVVLNVNKEKQEISLGLKQTEINPWEIAAQKYPSGTIVKASVRSMTNYGAFVEIEPGIDGMIHISDLSWTKKYGHPSEILQKGQEVKCVVLDVNKDKQRVSLGIKQMTEDPWIRAIPEKYIPGHIIKGKIAKLTNFGAFVELEPDLEGLLHISELADHKIEKPADVVKQGDEVEVKILKVDPEARKIGLSLRRVQWSVEEHAASPARQKEKENEVGRSTPASAGASLPLQKQGSQIKSDQGKKAKPSKPSDTEGKSATVETSEIGQEKAIAESEPSIQPQERPDVGREANSDGSDEQKTEET
jgi:small subunit ribosomal protein S1